jgi:hypothetical protein
LGNSPIRRQGKFVFSRRRHLSIVTVLEDLGHGGLTRMRREGMSYTTFHGVSIRCWRACVREAPTALLAAAALLLAGAGTAERGISFRDATIITLGALSVAGMIVVGWRRKRSG